jgi:hypothetical protein
VLEQECWIERCFEQAAELFNDLQHLRRVHPQLEIAGVDVDALGRHVQLAGHHLQQVRLHAACTIHGQWHGIWLGVQLLASDTFMDHTC